MTEQEKKKAAQKPRASGDVEQFISFSSSSATIGPAWVELTQLADITLTAGAGYQVVADLVSKPPGAQWFINQLKLPMMACVLPPGMSIPQAGIANSTGGAGITGLPAGVGINWITVTPGETTMVPPEYHLNINLAVQTAGTIPAGTRWFVFTMMGV
jgi:hypothetical protein